MSDNKNINTESDFQDRTGLVVWLKTKRNVKRLMKYGFLHYVSKKMNYALLYVDNATLENTIKRLKKEKNVQAVEISKLKDLPIQYDDVLPELRNEIEKQKEEEQKKSNPFIDEKLFNNND